eukprot:GFYU01005356.1.p1 GENE.GFYU01005356.1~~GFYU01005356.1.p1  ORF type:complete len:391 (+),score=54.02 GFYU01005356.1:123-1175(+)
MSVSGLHMNTQTNTSQSRYNTRYQAQNQAAAAASSGVLRPHAPGVTPVPPPGRNPYTNAYTPHTRSPSPVNDGTAGQRPRSQDQPRVIQNPSAQTKDESYHVRVSYNKSVRTIVLYPGISPVEIAVVLNASFPFLQEDEEVVGLKDPAGVIYPLSYVSNHPNKFEMRESTQKAARPYVLLVATDRVEYIPPTVADRIWDKKKDIAFVVFAVLVAALIRDHGPMIRHNSRQLWGEMLVQANDAWVSSLKHLYRTGPTFTFLQAHLGFWGGQDLATVCGQITGQAASFWQEHMSECQAIYNNKENAFVVSVQSTLGLLLGIFVVLRVVSTAFSLVGLSLSASARAVKRAVLN